MRKVKVLQRSLRVRKDARRCREIKTAGGRKGKIDDCLHHIMNAAHGIRTGLTGYALAAMVHCNIFLLQRTIPMSCSQSIREEQTAA
ncbi:hypothetical protein [Mesorhizobium sp. WSM4884]|uniref:hypothetical protein n=1 Tax=Mesorhizobium sp. WSM4884 TaxID=3038542 RepID=UPI002417C040|nr:hypothetical protein [Mesorhizobium sp. WSM4884]MDG4885150.1 hypothetical protein [Mesorhizobium sp. WSM4884]